MFAGRSSSASLWRTEQRQADDTPDGVTQQPLMLRDMRGTENTRITFMEPFLLPACLYWDFVLGNPTVGTDVAL